MRRSVFGLTLLMMSLWLGARAQADSNISSSTLEVAPNVVLAGRLRDEAIPSLAARSALVVDLRTAGENIQADVQRLEEANVEYVNIPVVRTPLHASTVERFAGLLTQHSDRFIVVNCASGNRAGLLWAAHRLVQGATAQAAISEVETIVTKEPARQAILEFARGLEEQGPSSQ